MMICRVRDREGRRLPGRLLGVRSNVELCVVVLAATVACLTAGASVRSSVLPVRVAILTDCAGLLAFTHESALGGTHAALAQYAEGVPRRPGKPSAGIGGVTVAGRPVQVIQGCGDGSVRDAIAETKRLMEERDADVMIGPVAGAEATAVAQYAALHPAKTFVLGSGGSQEPTLQLAPGNVFRYHGDDAQRNAGIGELVFRRLGWRKAVVIVDDNTGGWTSAAGIVADFCASGGLVLRRVYVPPDTKDYLPYIRQLPPPVTVDGYFWAVADAPGMLRAFAQQYGPADARQHVVDLQSDPGAVARRLPRSLVGAYASGVGTAPGLRTRQAQRYEGVLTKWYPRLFKRDPTSRFAYDYYNAALALVVGLRAARGDLTKLAASMPRAIRAGYQQSAGGMLSLDRNRQAIQDEYQLRIVRRPNGVLGTTVVAQVPQVRESFGGLFTVASPPPGRTFPSCAKVRLPWAGKIRVVERGAVTSRLVK